jgi:RimJ/RimL family protein N-acetyltransferase
MTTNPEATTNPPSTTNRRASTFPPRSDLTDGVVLLREPGADDSDAIVAGATTPDVVRYTRVPSPYGPDDVAAILRIAREGWTASTDAVFAVCDAAEPSELLGLIGLHGVDLTGDPGGTGEVGYWLRTEGRGRGLMTRSVRLVSDWAFRELGLAVITWYAVAGNDASRRVAEAAGYTVEGMLRLGAENRGRREDTWVGSLLPDDLRR